MDITRSQIEQWVLDSRICHKSHTFNLGNQKGSSRKLLLLPLKWTLDNHKPVDELLEYRKRLHNSRLHNCACQKKISKTARCPLFHFSVSNLICVHLLMELNLHLEPYLQGSLDNDLNYRSGVDIGRITSSVSINSWAYMCTKVLEEAYYTRHNRSQRRERSVLTGVRENSRKETPLAESWRTTCRSLPQRGLKETWGRVRILSQGKKVSKKCSVPGQPVLSLSGTEGRKRSAMRSERWQGSRQIQEHGLSPGSDGGTLEDFTWEWQDKMGF